jgi:hypothetical protein
MESAPESGDAADAPVHADRNGIGAAFAGALRDAIIALFVTERDTACKLLPWRAARLNAAPMSSPSNRAAPGVSVVIRSPNAALSAPSRSCTAG